MFSNISRFSLHSTKRCLQTRFSSSSATYTIELAKPFHYEKTLDLIMDNFISNEPFAQALIPGKKPKMLRNVFEGFLRENLSVIAQDRAKKCEIIGVAVNSRTKIGVLDKFVEFAKQVDDPQLRKLFETLAFVETNSNIHEKLCQEEIFTVEFLGVHENYNRKGIAMEIMQKSVEIAMANDFEYIKGTCVNENSKKLLEKLKWKRFWSEPYETLLCRGNIRPRAMPADPHKHAYVYYKTLKNSQFY